MDLLERYLQAVRFLLPKKQRHDVDRELSEDLRSQIEEKEAALGRPLGEDELAAVLKSFGHPVILALRYQQERYLIGPMVFPLFWLAVKYVLGFLAIVQILLPTVYFAVTGEPGRIASLFRRFPGEALPVLAGITLCFAVLETKVVRSALEGTLAGWNPRSLPPLAREEAPKPPSAAGFAVSVLFTVWWLVGLRYPRLVLGPGADYLAFGPTFERLYVPMVAAAALGLIHGWIGLTRPHRARLLFWSGLATDAVGLVVLSQLARGGEWFVAAEQMARLPAAERILEAVTLALTLGLNVALVVSIVTLAWKYLSYARRHAWAHRPAPPRTS